MQRRSTTSLIALAAAGLVLGCGGPSRPDPATVNAYLQKLQAGQLKLAAAERRIPQRARSPMALSRSITLLARASGRLGGDLAVIRPPKLVSSLHARLVATIDTYVRALQEAAATARSGDERRAGTMLIQATTTASSTFGATATSINRELGR